MLRQARLQPSRSNAYPALTPGKWYTAAAAAGLLTATRIVQEGPSVAIDGRVLPERDFDFRGGSTRRDCWVGLKTRRGDRLHYVRTA